MPIRIIVARVRDKILRAAGLPWAIEAPSCKANRVELLCHPGQAISGVTPHHVSWLTVCHTTLALEIEVLTRSNRGSFGPNSQLSLLDRDACEFFGVGQVARVVFFHAIVVV